MKSLTKRYFQAALTILSNHHTHYLAQFADISLQPKFEAQFWPETEENYEDVPGSRGKRNPQFSRNNFKTPFNLQEILVTTLYIC